MPTTSPDSLYFPDESTQVAPLQTLLATMQSSVQTALTDIRSDLSPTTIPDSGWTLSGITANSPAFTGLSDSQGRTTGLKGGMRKWGQMVELRFRVTKGPGTITANDQGNIGDATVATISNTAFRPAGTVYGFFDYGPGLGSGGARVDTAGGVAITDFYPKAKIEAGNQIQINIVYMVG